MTGLFRSTQDALLFAFRHAGQAYDRPLMLRMADASRGSGAGLAGLDGAAQAGMIRAEVAALGRLHEAVLVARFADRAIPCQCKAACCSGERRVPGQDGVEPGDELAASGFVLDAGSAAAAAEPCPVVDGGV